MKLTDEHLQQTAAVLYKAVTDQNVKLAFGGRIRAANKQALDKGEMPQNYRIEWLKQARHKMIDALTDIASDFNAKYPHDRCSTIDLMDVLLSTTAQFRKAVKDGLGKDKPTGS